MAVVGALLVAYFVWAVYVGWNYVNAKQFAILERKGIQYKILKAVVGYVLGVIFGIYYLMRAVVKFILRTA